LLGFVLVLGTGLLVGVAGATESSCHNARLRLGASAGLPDCRVYEQVSPVDKNGFDAVLGATFPVQAAAPSEEGLETSISYMNFGSFTDLQGGELPGSELPNAYVSSRSVDGWQTRTVTPPTPQGTPAGGYFLGYDFSEDLSKVVIRVPLQILTPNAPPDVFNLYLLHPSGGYSLVTTVPPVPSPPSNCSSCSVETDVLAFAGSSSDFSHILFEANDSLLPGAPGGGVESLYESSGGQVSLVGVLPDGVVAGSGSAPGAGLGVFYSSPNRAQSGDVDHAISRDGWHVLFQATADAGGPDPAQNGLTEVFDRVNSSRTLEISAPAENATPANATAEPAQFWAASADGSLVFFTSLAELTTQSNTGSSNAGQDLYQYDGKTGVLTDLTVDHNPSDAASGADVLGVVGAAEDGSYVYFVAKGQLVPGKGTDGQPNLYVWHEGAINFIATLNEAGDTNDWTSTPVFLQAYVTPDGRHLAFMSINGLTGYDNIDRRTAKPDSEVYEYSVGSGGETGHITCASCDPNGVPPVGSAFIGATLSEEASTPFHQPRALSNDGARMFFSSPDQLVSGLSSPYVKIFEYENGSVHRISSAANSENDVFLDASPSGNDVFFATRDQLAPTDQDNLEDVYDARVNGGFPESVPPVSCQGGACQGPPGAPPVLPAPSSASFAGLGNIPLPAASTAKTQRSKNKKHSNIKIKIKKKAAKRAAKKAKSRRSRARGVGGGAL
jgi:hypothetical protein